MQNEKQRIMHTIVMESRMADARCYLNGCNRHRDTSDQGQGQGQDKDKCSQVIDKNRELIVKRQCPRPRPQQQ